ncbi:MAG: hypothetical protein IJM44_04280 [Ruminococcus sp.]|nr:hypothetical protein [Ruminococcus sp.]
MLCMKCKKEIPDDFLYCNFCGKKQIIKPKPKYHKREHGTGTIHRDKRYKRLWVALAPASKYGKGRQYIGCYATRNEARQALDDFARSGKPDLYNATFASLSAAAGVQPENLQKIIGHASFSTTAEVYIHQDVATLIDEMRKINK